MAHFYLPDGTPFYEVPNKARGGMRSANIRDARAVGAYPSVTGIIGIPAKPGLEKYFRTQAVLAAFEWAVEQVRKKNGVRKMSIIQLIRFVWSCLRTWSVPADALNEMLEISRRHAREAADKGGDIHDAIEAHFLGKHIPPEHHATVNAVLALLEEKCGPQEWEAEKWFASPLGYGGKIDLISPEWVIDFKTKPGEASDHKMYDEQLMQLMAYDMGVPVRGKNEPHWTRGGNFPAPRRKANVIVSRDIPGSVSWWSWDGADEERQWDLFCLLLQYWQSRNNYWPHLEQAA